MATTPGGIWFPDPDEPYIDGTTEQSWWSDLAHSVEDYVDALVAFPIQERRRSTDQTIPNNTETQLSFNVTAHSNTQGAFTTTGTTVNWVRPGVYGVGAGVRWGSSSTGSRLMLLRHNSTAVASTRSAAEGFTTQSIYRELRVEQGDTLVVGLLQNSGGSLAATGDARTYQTVRFIRD